MQSGHQTEESGKYNLDDRADEMHGQICIVLKDYDAVITITAHNEIEHKDIIRAVWKDVLPLL